MSERKLKLALSLYGVGGPGQHNLWKDPRVPKNASIDINWYIQQAQKAEAAKFDAIFIVDSLFINSTLSRALPQPAGAAHPAVGPRGGDREHRPGRHPQLRRTTRRSTWPGGSPRSTRSAAAAPAGTSSPASTLGRRGQLRARRALRLRHPVRPGAGVRRGGPGPVGLLRGRRLPGRRRAGRVPRSRASCTS